jgi:hypothetical protein
VIALGKHASGLLQPPTTPLATELLAAGEPAATAPGGCRCGRNTRAARQQLRRHGQHRRPRGRHHHRRLLPVALHQEISSGRTWTSPAPPGRPARKRAATGRPVPLLPLYPRPPVGAGAGHAGAHLTTSTKASAPPAAQAQHGRAQAFYNKEAGVKRITTETGAGQWGSSLAFAGAMFGLEIQVFMVKVSYQPEAVSARADGNLSARAVSPARRWKPSPAAPSSPSVRTAPAVSASRSPRRWRWPRRAGHQVRARQVLNHVLLHQTVIGLEAIEATGDGRRLSGRHHRLHRRRQRTSPASPSRSSASSCAAGRQVGSSRSNHRPARAHQGTLYAYDFGDTAHLTPLVKMHTLGSTFTPPGFHAGGLRYHGMAPLVSHLKELGLIEARSYQPAECFEAGVFFRASRRHRPGAGGQPRREGRHP